MIEELGGYLHLLRKPLANGNLGPFSQIQVTNA